ncbi:ABC transporter ATP-binding protein [Caproiciproducens galactitolivorans]|uniref:ABC transporter ATP-binding protein n=1 Tax=Caproiciproducens galactitolivorans TaxID=642589 RepID=A0ABT4BTW1_9FIRM|nr:ABC transporter ATP-binding protein [Caproiciproducens galactitolivorans]MCY1713513.1 ABC transporter ATP-binding protein [Caproiciproducens galactitolivorans]
MSERKQILKIRDLSVSFHTANGLVRAVRGLNMDVYKGETVAIVGESGSGKSVTVKEVMGIHTPNEVIEGGSIAFTYDSGSGEKTVDLLTISPHFMQNQLKGKHIAMVFQDPMTSLDPTMTIGKQLMEGMMLHLHLSRKEAAGRAVELLQMVGISDPEKRLKNYPHQLSGGMRQRVVIAIALSCDPDLLICDEPTTALDVTIQARILQLIMDLQKKFNISVIFITHNLGVVAKVADYVNVMYAGKIIETGRTEDVFFDPRHPYTWGLLSSMPDLSGNKEDRLYTIQGNPPNLLNEIKGDAFAPRNPYALEIDFEEEPPMFKINSHHQAATWLLDPRSPKVEMPDQLRRRIEIMKREDASNGGN